MIEALSNALVMAFLLVVGVMGSMVMFCIMCLALGVVFYVAVFNDITTGHTLSTR